MSKSKNQSSNADMDRIINKITKDLEEKNFGSLEEANEYINEKYIGKEIKTDNKKLSRQNKAMDLVYEAWDSESEEEMISLAEKALALDDNCVDAYNILAEQKAENPYDSLELFAKGIEAGKKNLGKNYEELKGHFWGVHETRPFMRSMAGYTHVLWLLGEKSKSIEVTKEMLILNPNDNQGMRYILITRLLLLHRFQEAENLLDEFVDDYSAQWHYSKAYLCFNRKSKRFKADKLLKEAMEFNPYVPLYLFGLIDMPETIPSFTGIGDADEAIVYVDHAYELWGCNKKAVVWFADMHRKMKKELDLLIENREKEQAERFGIGE